MFKLDVSAKEIGEFIGEMDETEFVRFMYCQKIAATYMAIQLLEHRVIDLMLMCNRIELKKVLGSDLSNWDKLMHKQEVLRSSTLGSLISMLARNDIASADICYLRWVKDKRDYFVHRLFHENPWPGEVDIYVGRRMMRRLQAIEIWMNRAEIRLLQIFQRADLVSLSFTDSQGVLVSNLGIFDELGKVEKSEEGEESRDDRQESLF